MAGATCGGDTSAVAANRVGGAGCWGIPARAGAVASLVAGKVRGALGLAGTARGGDTSAVAANRASGAGCWGIPTRAGAVASLVA